MKHQEVVEKIRKLLALAEGSTGPEAEVALSMANNLLIKYNISIRDIDGNVFDLNADSKTRFVETLIEMPSGFGALEYWASCVIRDHFFVSTIVNRPKGVPENGPCNLLVLGEKHNVEIAWYVFRFIKNKFSELWSKYQANTGCPKTQFESFIAGLFYGLDAKLKADKSRLFGSSKALLVIQSELKTVALSLITNSSPKGLNSNDTAKYNSETMRDGRKIGKTIEIFPAVYTKTNPTKKIA